MVCFRHSPGFLWLLVNAHLDLTQRVITQLSSLEREREGGGGGGREKEKDREGTREGVERESRRKRGGREE